MNKTCARCEKTVYPTEELKCLDKVWHKGCFKCQECGMTLNMRTYKGYGKLPYCESHVPKAKHTTMAETPELKRIAENTKIQSNVKYHADFEKSKGKFTQVADDPETLRIKANTRIISNVAYHGDLEKKAQMEKQRQINENGELVDVQTDYNQQIDNYATEMLPPPNLPPRNNYSQQYQPTTQYTPNHNQSMHPPINNQNTPNLPQAHIAPHQNLPQVHATSHPNLGHQVTPHPNVAHQVTSHQNVPHNVTSHHAHHNVTNYQQRYPDQYYKAPKDDYAYQYQEYQNQQKIGRIQDYDPLSDGPRTVPNTQRASATLIYNSTNDKRGGHQSSQSQPRAIGRVTDMDPLAADTRTHTAPAPTPASAPAPTPTHNQKVYIAMYDYDSNDTDEVSFREGDLISNVSSIDEGWMTGQVLRTGHAGMLPANYVAECPPQQHTQY